MNAYHFKRWTRRSLGWLAGGMAGALLGRVTPDDAGAGKTRRRRRCKRLGSSCRTRGKTRCCGNLRCEITFDSSPSDVCCKREGETCDADIDCCGERGRCRTNGCDNPATVCCGVIGAPCVIDCDCCEGFNCLVDGECGQP